ncbi:MAG TPA: porin family protein [Nevskiaceae bacterium]|nr:porin family protein [Nevskiaceae bacterium]
MRTASKLMCFGAGCTLACAPALALAAQAPGAGYWAGPYIGGELGLNDASGDHVSSSTAFTVSPHIGYNAAVPLRGAFSPLILGADFFGEFNTETDHGPAHFGSNVFGVDFLAGMPIGTQRRLMPYVKLGFGDLVGTGDLDGSDTSLRVGVGAEYHLQRNWGLRLQWIHQDADHITNNNFTAGVDYHFGGY